MVGYNVLFGIYLVLALYGCIAGGIFTAFETENEKNILICAFYLQIIFYENLKGKLNATGIVIVLIVSSALLLPCNILILTIKTLVLVCGLFWAMFKRVFKKKPAEETVVHCNREENAKIIAHILEFDSQNMVYDWYEQHIANIAKYYEGKSNSPENPDSSAVNVVRCKDCRYFYDGYDEKCCINSRGVVVADENGFCHHAERRVDNG